MLIDSHCHLEMLDLTSDNGDLNAPIERARKAGVKHLITIGTDLVSSRRCIEFAKSYPDVSATIGVHPSDVKSEAVSDDVLLSLASESSVVAIGETGLDYYHHADGHDAMQASFRQHIRIAKAVKKPLIIHTREAQEDTIRLMREEQASDVGGVMHCFTESIAMAEKAMALGFYISFSGIVTFKNATDVQTIAKAVPLERMLVETDAPYLAPVPHRGKKNEPAFVRCVAEYLADLKKVSYEEFIAITGENTCRLFSLDIAVR
jgi:TatD DNase family protein